VFSGLYFHNDAQVARAVPQAAGELMFVTLDEVPAAKVARHNRRA
jgi:hypothetical protein